jgi:tRNA A-37 threonylcarbamoyl transferase component Bud32
MEPYDLCRIVHDTEDASALFPTARRQGRGGTYTFWDPPVSFALDKQLGKGSYGLVYHGRFKSKSVAVKINKKGKVPLATDANEVRMQARLSCHLRSVRSARGAMARVPETYFSVTTERGRALGMERVDSSLLAHLLARKGDDQVRVLREAVRQIAALLVVLQDDLKFVHGDLHGENAMVRGGSASFQVYLIDFGMSSTQGPQGRRAERVLTDTRYEGVPYNKHLDMLTLLTSLREDFGTAMPKRVAAAEWCDQFVAPFWDVVRKSLFSGTARPGRLRYHAEHTVLAARDELKESGEIYYAHHLLYNDIGNVAVQRCAPKAVLRALKAGQDKPCGKPSKRSKRKELRDRVFSDVRR